MGSWDSNPGPSRSGAWAFDRFQAPGTASQKKRIPWHSAQARQEPILPSPETEEVRCPPLTSEFDVAFLIQKDAAMERWESGRPSCGPSVGSGDTMGPAGIGSSPEKVIHPGPLI